jgi:hypothetical protein
MVALAGIYNITIEKGVTFTRVLTVTDSEDNLVDFTGYTARMAIKKHRASGTVILSLTTENGRITLGGAAGTVILGPISDVITAAIEEEAGVYDLELIQGGVVQRLIKGVVVFDPEVT